MFLYYLEIIIHICPTLVLWWQLLGCDGSVSYVKLQCWMRSVPLQAWSGPEGSRKLRFPEFMTTAQSGGKVVSLTHRPHLPPGNSPGTHFCQRLSRPQDHSAIGRIMSMKISNDTIWNRTSDLPICWMRQYCFFYWCHQWSVLSQVVDEGTCICITKICFTFWGIAELFLCIIHNLGTYVWALEDLPF